MNNGPLVSVIMPVYNTPISWLTQAINSVLRQTYSKFEFIIINDGSSFHVSKHIESFFDSRIRVIKNFKNLGISRSLNKGFANSMGEFILRFDADDIMADNRIEEQVRYLLENRNVSFVGSWFKVIDENGVHKSNVKLPTRCSHIDYHIAFKKDPSVGHPMVMFRAKAVLGNLYNDFYGKNRCEDYDLFLRLRSLGYCYENVPLFLMDYRVHSQQISSSPSKIGTRIAYREFKNRILDIPTEKINESSRSSIIDEFLISLKIFRKLRSIKPVVW